MSGKVIKSLKQLCTNAKSVSLTLSLWSDHRLHSYLGITMHTIIQNELHSYPLSFERSKGGHIAINILSEFHKVVKFYELENKLVRIVTDNASNNMAAFDNLILPGFDDYFNNTGGLDGTDNDYQLSLTTAAATTTDNQDWNDEEGEEIEMNSGDEKGIDIEWEKSGFISKDSLVVNLPDQDFALFGNITVNGYLRIPCFAHTLQLVIHDGIYNSKPAFNALKKVAAIAKFSRTSCVFAERLELTKQSIPIATVARWISQFYTI
ncbi:unnamed protein product, partial [Didymodactylos carnosus]